MINSECLEYHDKWYPLSLAQRAVERSRRLLVQAPLELTAADSYLPLKPEGIDAVGNDIQSVGHPTPCPVTHQCSIVAYHNTQGLPYMSG